MNELLKSFYKMSGTYRLEASGSLPWALLTLRDSMIEIDKKVSESLVVENGTSPNKNISEVS